MKIYSFDKLLVLDLFLVPRLVLAIINHLIKVVDSDSLDVMVVVDCFATVSTEEHELLISQVSIK